MKRESPSFKARSVKLTNDEAYDLAMAVAYGTLDAVEQIASRLATRPW